MRTIPASASAAPPRRHGNAGTYGNNGNVVSVSYIINIRRLTTAGKLLKPTILTDRRGQHRTRVACAMNCPESLRYSALFATASSANNKKLATMAFGTIVSLLSSCHLYGIVELNVIPLKVRPRYD